MLNIYLLYILILIIYLLAMISIWFLEKKLRLKAFINSYFSAIKMVKLTLDLISKTHKRKNEENINQYLNRITHFYLQDKSIDEVVSNF